MAKNLPDSLKTIVIAGGTGLVANALRHGLKSIGCRVITITNKEVENSLTWEQFKSEGLPANTSSVINTCGKSIFTPKPFNMLKKELYDSRVGTNLILREAILKAPVKPQSFITLSGAGLYKADPSIIHDENSTQFTNDFWTDLIQKWEAATELPDTFPTRRVMIRSGVVLSRLGGMIKNMYPAFYLNFGGPIGDGKQYVPCIHIKDLIKLITFCAEEPSISGPVNAVLPRVCTMNELTETLAKVMHRMHLVRTPEFVIRQLMAKERADLLLSSVKVLPKKSLDNGFEFYYPDIYSSIGAGLMGIKRY